MVTLVCPEQCLVGIAYLESSVSPSSSAGRAMRTIEVFGQLEPGRSPVTLQTVASTWVLHISVGTVPLAKYSV